MTTTFDVNRVREDFPILSRKVYGKPLISYTVRQAIKSKVFREVVVSTDSKKIQAKTGNYNPVELEKEVAERWGKDKNVSDRHDQIRKEICLAYRLLSTVQ